MQLAIEGLGRNFGGLYINEDNYTTGLNLFISKLSDKYSYLNAFKRENIINNNIQEKILDNLTKSNHEYLSRYLLLISKSNIGIYLLSSFLKSIINKNKSIIYIGSMFIDDQQKEEYSTKILSKIKMNMETDKILILKDLDSIYPSLYDLFNQNFVKIQDKKYARIALGSRTNSFSQVNDNFRCIIIVDEDKIPNQEIPFLNRFEKQSISFENLMSDGEIYIANKLYDICQNLIKYEKKKNKLFNFDLSNLLINCNEQEILGIVYMSNQNKITKDYKDINYYENELFSRISQTFPQDIILLLLENKTNNNDLCKKILYYYNQNVHNNIKDFLLNINPKKNNKYIIYTFTRIIDSIKQKYLKSLNIKLLDEISINNIKEIRLSLIQNEFQLESEIEHFLYENYYKICFIKLSTYEYSTIDYLKTIIENKEEDFKIKNKYIYNKVFIFLVHLERIYKKELENSNINKRKILNKKKLKGTLSNLAGYYQIFIDDINGKDYYDKNGDIITLDKIPNINDEDLYRIFLDLNMILIDNLNKLLFFFDYNFVGIKNELTKERYINDLLELFETDKNLIKLINEFIINNIKNDNYKHNENIFEKIIREEEYINEDICVYDIITKSLTKKYLNEFQILYIGLENNYYFSSILNRKNNYLESNNIINIKNEFSYKINEIFLNNIKLKNNIPEKEVKLNIIIGFNLPVYNLLIDLNNYIISKIIEKYRQIEDEFKNLNFEDKDDKEEEEVEEDQEFKIEKEKYNNNIEFLNNMTYEKLYNNKIIKSIKDEDYGIKEQFFNILLEDYLLFFIYKNYKEEKSIYINDFKLFFKMILNNKFDMNKTNNIKDFCSKINWIETYSFELISILTIFGFLRESINDLINKVNEQLNKNKLILKPKNYSDNLNLINGVFYLCIESLIQILIINLNILLKKIKFQEQFNNFINELNNIYYSILIINNNLNLKSKEIYSLHESINVIKLLSFDKPEDEIEKEKDFMITFIHKKIIKENKDKLNKEKKGAKLKVNIEGKVQEIEDTKEEKKLKDILKNFNFYYLNKQKENYIYLFSSVLFDEFNKEYNEKYRQFIIKTILVDNNLINSNNLLIKKIFSENLFPELEDMERAFDIISNEEIFFSLFNDSKNKTIEELVMKNFNSIINICFESSDNLEELITTDLFNNFRTYINLLNENKYMKYYNENVCKLFAICYIKLYLQKFVYYLYRKANFLGGNEVEIIQEIHKNYKISNTIQIYFLILLYNEIKSINKMNEYISKENSLEPIFYYIKQLKREIGENNLEEFLKHFSSLNHNLKKENYPFSEYFIYTEYPTLDNFKENISSIDNKNGDYPLIKQYIKDNTNTRKLKFLKSYNDFVNLMINTYSGKISRNDAENKVVLNKEEIYKDEIFQKDLNHLNLYGMIIFGMIAIIMINQNNCRGMKN